MANVRVYELAKELNMSNHDLMTMLADLGIEVKSHASTLDEGVAVQIRETLNKDGGNTVTSIIEEKREITLPGDVTVRQLGELLGVTVSEIQKALMKQGTLVAVNQVLAPELATKVAESFGYAIAIPEPPKVETPAPKPEPEPKPVEVETETEAVSSKPQAPKPKAKPKREEVLVTRPPIVTILGHVDHGKTTLLDAIRKTNVTEQEFGGITQHIGAYQVDVKGRKITFLDTPGHAAFTAMRARGAQVTDIVILVVAADDGVMPQTIEALNHAKAAGVQIIAAINKIDKDNANPDRVKQQLAEHGLVIEEWGGDIVSVGISAKSRLNLDDLLDMILLVSDLLELKADPGSPVEATVVEAQLDRGKGPVATVLVQTGTLKQGDAVLVGQAYGRIKAMNDYHGNKLKEAGPSTPVEVIGLSTVPMAGDKLEVVKNEREARQIAESRFQTERTDRLSSTQRVTLADLYKQLVEGSVKELNLVLKTDVQGSEEAIRESLVQLSTDEVRVNLIHSGIGPVGENDVLLASASNAIVIGFNVRVDPPAKRTAEVEKIDIRTYQIIYELLDEVKAGMEGLLEPVIEETVIGHAEVRQLFRLPKGGSIAGSYVKDGKIQRDAQARILRGRDVIHTGKISSLKHIKEDVREMAAGFEFGITVEGFTDFQVDDTIEAFVVEEIARKI
ncbi:MAG: translation initiation factor IF-2 [Armatimonadota bacterium]